MGPPPTKTESWPRASAVAVGWLLLRVLLMADSDSSVDECPTALWSKERRPRICVNVQRTRVFESSTDKTLV